MAGYEEVELGFEGVDKFADKYHDKVYDHLPAISKSRQKQRRSSQNPDKGYYSETYRSYEADANMYAPDGRQERDYRPGTDERYYEDDRSYYRASDAGSGVPRGRDDLKNTRGAVAAYQQPQQDYSRQRPAHQRRRSSWSPPRSEKHDRDERDSHKPRTRSRSRDKQHRIIATVGGALVGGIAGNQAGKGKKYDTVATIVGAIVGGVGAREASEFWDDRRRKRGEQDEEWEEEHGDDRASSRRRDDKYEPRRQEEVLSAQDIFTFLLRPDTAY
ncbi:hypothetical protein BKA66DRAFT_158034 [Pyrenochaeta sp. MPI-SDFR-AT-0127]|nr:hypothetical protein BKA66DRAFT_158034 [Pyrenochaeta sp. MPI-SDFR-AT-0127]